MCGILALCHSSFCPDLGEVGSGLLGMLAYRGRGAGAGVLAEGAGPKLVTQAGPSDAALATLGLSAVGGSRFLGHVAWQPEDLTPCQVSCRRPLVGVVHGRVTNGDVLRPLLAAQSHRVSSGSPGALLTHLMEDLIQAPPPPDPHGLPPAAMAMVAAARTLVAKADGVFAAAFADPQGQGLVCLSSGLAVHAGLGKDKHGTYLTLSTELGAVLQSAAFLIPMEAHHGLWTDGRIFARFNLRGPLVITTPRPERPRMTAADAALPRPLTSRLAQACAQAPERLDALRIACTRDEAAEPYLDVFEARRDLAQALAVKVRALREALDDLELLAALQALRMDPVHRELMGLLRPHLSTLRSDGWPPRSDHRAILQTLAHLAPEALDELATWDQLLRWTVQDAVGLECEALAATLHRGARVFLVADGAFRHAAETAAWALGRMAGGSIVAATPTALRTIHLRGLGPEDHLLLLAPRGLASHGPLLKELRARVPALRRVVIGGAFHDAHDPEWAEAFLPLAFGPQAPGSPDAAFLPLVSLLRGMAARAAGGTALATRILAMDREAAAALPRISGEALDSAAARLHDATFLHLLSADGLGPARAGARLLAATARIQAAADELDAFLDGPATALPGTPHPLLILCPPLPEAVARVRAAIDPLLQRGADILLLAEPEKGLKDHLNRRIPGPANRDSRFVPLPETGDPDAFALTSALALHHLALRLAERKAESLERAGIHDHGLHPDGDGSTPGSTAPCPPAIW